MHTPAIDAVIRMMEPLPPAVQEQVSDHVRAYIQSLLDESNLDTQPQQDILELDEL